MLNGYRKSHNCIDTGCTIYLSPASLEFAEGAEEDEFIF